RAFREASVWRQLRHAHILPFLGMSTQAGLPHLVSPYMENGTAPDYIRRNPGVNRLQLLVHAARGLLYMHKRPTPIIHGDLKGDNILVSADGTAYLSDFGLARPLEYRPNLEPLGEALPSQVEEQATGGNFRWQAPELILTEGSKSCASDVYSFGRVIEEILTGEIPFGSLASDSQVMMQVIQGIHQRPIGDYIVSCGMDDSMWSLTLCCWAMEPFERPSISDILDSLNSM
ncbi:hypothetical protein BOTBODRAFT_85348, partial [Botryobasidium botryosum FD-172 SS1]